MPSCRPQQEGLDSAQYRPSQGFCHNKARKAEEKEGKDSQESNEEPARGIANVGQVDQEDNEANGIGTAVKIRSSRRQIPIGF